RIHITGAEVTMLPLLRAENRFPLFLRSGASDPLEAHVGELLAEAVHVEAELARSEALALVAFVGFALLRRLEHFRGFGALHHAHTVVVGHDHVARLDVSAGADHRYVDAAEAGLDRALREDALRPDREVHFLEVAHVAHAGVDDQPAHTARLGAGGEEIAEVAVFARARRRDHQHVAFAALLDGRMDHVVVARRNGDRHRRRGDAGTRVDRSHVAGEETGAALRLMHRGDAASGKPVYDRQLCAFDVLDDNTVHFVRFLLLCCWRRWPPSLFPSRAARPAVGRLANL